MDNPDSAKGLASRSLITGPSMYSLLIREFARLKAPDGTCSCRVPLPFWGPAPESESGYWYLETLGVCPHGCARVLAVLWAKLTTEYKVVPPEKEQVQWKHGVRVLVATGEEP